MKRPRLMEPLEETDEEEYNDEDKAEEYPGGIIRFEAGQWGQLGGEYSPRVEVEGLPWRAHIYMDECDVEDEGEYHVAVYLCGIENKSGLWSIDVHYKIVIVNCDSSKNRVKEDDHTFKHDSTMGGSRVMLCGDICDEDDDIKGFNNDNFTIVIYFWITNMTGIRRIPPIDFTDPNKHSHDATFVIEGEKIYANKQILALYSSFFNSMFYGNFAEKNKKEIELKDVNREKFIELLNQIYPSYKKITDDNAEILLELSDRFLIKKIIDQVEEFLIDSSKMKCSAKRILSEQYRLAKLQEFLITRKKAMPATTPNVVVHQSIDFSDPNDPRHNFTLVIGEEKIYVNKQYLSLHSPWFSAKLAGKNKMKLRVNRDEILEMLQVIYPCRSKKVTVDNVDFLLKLANRFDIKLLFDLAEEHLISSTLNDEDKLLISDKYKLNELQHHILAKDEDTLGEIKDGSKYQKLSNKTKMALMESMIDQLRY